MTIEQAKKSFIELQNQMTAYKNVCSLLYYDASVGAPKKSVESRKQILGVLEDAGHKLMNDKKTRHLLSFLEEHREELDGRERRMLELLLRNERETGRIPAGENTAYQKLRITAYDVWHRAKAQSDFSMLEPYLKEIFDVKKRFAGYMDSGEKPYDVWLGQYERGLTMEHCDSLFARLKEKIVPLIQCILDTEPVQDRIFGACYPMEEQKKLSDYVMEVMGLDREHCVLTESEHPGTTSLGRHDIRITTRYRPYSFVPAMSMVMHEGGHALYERNTAEEDAFTCLGTYASMGIYESQSRFYENLIGRSREFYEFLTPKLMELFPEQLRGASPEVLYRSANRVDAGPVRLEADELTYSMHIMIRYELEKALFAGDIKIKDLPGHWNEQYHRYLGVKVKSDREGVLQDSHWAYGSIGYFPSYALGNAYGAQMMREMERTVNVRQTVNEGNLLPIHAWLEKWLWRHGARYDPEELLAGIFGGAFDPDIYTDYLTKKYSEIYSV